MAKWCGLKKKDQEATGGWCSFIRPHRLSGADRPHAPGLFSELVASKDFSVARSCRLQHPTVLQAACLCVPSPTVGATLGSVSGPALCSDWIASIRWQRYANAATTCAMWAKAPRCASLLIDGLSIIHSLCHDRCTDSAGEIPAWALAFRIRFRQQEKPRR